MRHAAKHYGAKATGVTLSREGKKYCDAASASTGVPTEVLICVYVLGVLFAGPCSLDPGSPETRVAGNQVRRIQFRRNRDSPQTWFAIDAAFRNY